MHIFSRLIFPIVLSITFFSCTHKNVCWAPSPIFDSLNIRVKTSPTPQSILPSKYNPNATYTWYLLNPTPTNNYKFISQGPSPVLKYIFDHVRKSRFFLVTEQKSCYNDTTFLSINSSLPQYNSVVDSSPCKLGTGSFFKLGNVSYTDIGTPSLFTFTPSGCQLLTVQDFSNPPYNNSIGIFFPKTFSKSVILGAYLINVNTSKYELTGNDCSIEVNNTSSDNFAVNPSMAHIYITQGINRDIQMTICNYQYSHNGTIYNLEAKFEFDLQ